MTNLKWPADWPETVWDDAEWHEAMLYRLDLWLCWPRDEVRPPLPRWMGMNLQEFYLWRETGNVPRVTRTLWTIFSDEVLA